MMADRLTETDVLAAVLILMPESRARGRVTDAGLEHLKGMTQRQTLNL